mgnify:CR=1 FL=1
MPTLKGINYMQRASATVDYVKSKVRFGAANRPKEQPNIASVLRAAGALYRVRSQSDKAALERFVNPADAYRTAQVWAEKVEKYGGGNCGEQSALALVHLRKLGGAYPLTWVRFTNWDHAFVMIGWPLDDGWKPAAGWPPKGLPWFEDAVVCDPWDKHAYYWSEVWSKYNRAHLKRWFHRDAESDLTVWVNYNTK